MTMKALTIWQPWASLIITGAKPYEFRGWRAPRAVIGQTIVIHAAARKLDVDETLCMLRVLRAREQYPTDAGELCLIAEKAIPVLEAALRGQLPMSAGLGTATLGEPRLGTEIAEEFGVPRANDSDRDEHANWGWPMLDVVAFDQPFPMRGAQGLWTWPDAEAMAKEGATT